MAEQIWNGIIYDDDDFEIKESEGKEYLHYKGTAVDLRHFEIPKGMTSIHMMFAGTDIEYGPAFIPDGVTDVSYLYLDCKHLIEGSRVPNTVTNQDGEYDGCENLTDAKNISQNAVSINGYAANCASLESIDTIPDSVKEAESALEGCENITEVHGGKNVEKADGIYAGMTNLEVPSPEMNPDASMNDAFVGCSKMEEHFAEVDAEVQQEEMMNKVRANVLNKPVESKIDKVAAAEAALGDIPVADSNEISLG